MLLFSVMGFYELPVQALLDQLNNPAIIIAGKAPADAAPIPEKKE